VLITLKLLYLYILDFSLFSMILSLVIVLCVLFALEYRKYKLGGRPYTLGLGNEKLEETKFTFYFQYYIFFIGSCIISFTIFPTFSTLLSIIILSSLPISNYIYCKFKKNIYIVIIAT